MRRARADQEEGAEGGQSLVGDEQLLVRRVCQCEGRDTLTDANHEVFAVTVPEEADEESGGGALLGIGEEIREKSALQETEDDPLVDRELLQELCLSERFLKRHRECLTAGVPPLAHVHQLLDRLLHRFLHTPWTAVVAEEVHHRLPAKALLKVLHSVAQVGAYSRLPLLLVLACTAVSTPHCRLLSLYIYIHTYIYLLSLASLCVSLSVSVS